MKVLHLPLNIASQMSVTVRALRDIGIEARGLARADAKRIQDPSGLDILPEVLSPRRHPIRGSLQLLAKKRVVLNAICWADVVHWHYSRALPNGYDVKCATRLGKPGIVEFWGTDIRIPRIASADNPYMAQMYREMPELEKGAEAQSLKRQHTFGKHGVACLIPAEELLPYVDSSVFPMLYRTRQRLLLDEYEASYPDANQSRPLVVHMPSNKAVKGTDAVLRAIDELKQSHSFDFRLVHGVRRSEAMESVQSCDIFLDQFVVGDHGLATLEAMAFGKPAVCYIKPSLLPKHPPELPIVVANQENLTEVLKGLLEDGRRRNAIGRQSREYVERYHDSRQLAAQLVGIYEELLAAPRRVQR